MTPGTARPMRLATRGSRLALAQLELARQALRAAGVAETETIVVRTHGDRDQRTPVELMEGQGWFTAELELAVLDGRADLAVHSAKDLPSQLAPGLGVAAFLERGDCRDALVGTEGAGLEALPSGARVGTSSLRRSRLLGALRPDLEVVPMRGNVDTRLAKLDRGDVDALLLACAGLDRLGAAARVTERLDPRVFVPAPCQGAIALEAAENAAASRGCVPADHARTRTALVAERTVLTELGGGCLLPLGAWARVEEGRLVVSAALAVDSDVRRVELGGDAGDPGGVGRAVAARLR